ncbi:MAG: 4-hydroxy-3-methylbut-2-enyl diphosphate reductase [Spirochaetia bacterium]|nr:4-hydroxy-3-methylbut-2-enyl diphosphate reductase [Spirochaetia bacterium]
MKIVRAQVLGMCMGVRRAEENARKAAKRAKELSKSVFTYGPLIHNPQAVSALESLGVRVLDPEAFERGELDGIVNNAIVVIRAHGAPPEALYRLASLGAEVVDATCPRVLQSQKKAASLIEKGYSLAIAGDRSHGEVTGILGYAPGAVVVQNAEEAAILAKEWQHRPVALIAQTTIKKSEYDAITARFEAACPSFLAFDTLCPATAERQTALKEVAKRVEALLVVGGKNSANTQRLFMAAQETGKPAWHIETASELPKEIFRYRSVGLTAGASTPDSMVDDVESTLMKGERDGHASRTAKP